MGNTFEGLSLRRGVKRVFEDESNSSQVQGGEGNGNANNDASKDIQSELHVAKRKRTQSTAKYIQKTLFEQGQNSDVTIFACGREWHLHKLYLCQCKYFNSMFSGPWIESAQQFINIDISDENINEEALKITFQSLYTDNVFVKPIQAVGVVAAATFLQLDPLIDHCKGVMQGSINTDTVCMFYKAGEQYGLLDLKELCFTWLLHSLLVPSYSTSLSQVPKELVAKLICHKDLWMMQVEVDIYTLLKKWIFLQLNSLWSGSREQLQKDSEDYFKRKVQETGKCFLELDEGQQFIPLFEKVRWNHVIIDPHSIQLLKDDMVLPIDWLAPFFSFNWQHHLLCEQGTDKGPQNISEEEFNENCMRCGRILLTEQDYCWRWVGFNFGLDLLITYRNKTIVMKRNNGSQQFEGSLSQQQQRHLMVKLNISTIRKKDNCTIVKSSGMKVLTLCPEEEVMLIQLNSNMRFPLQVTMNLLVTTPTGSVPLPSLAVPPIYNSFTKSSFSNTDAVTTTVIATMALSKSDVIAASTTDVYCKEYTDVCVRTRDIGCQIVQMGVSCTCICSGRCKGSDLKVCHSNGSTSDEKTAGDQDIELLSLVPNQPSIERRTELSCTSQNTTLIHRPTLKCTSLPPVMHSWKSSENCVSNYDDSHHDSPSISPVHL